jgi:hypothetical protein
MVAQASLAEELPGLQNANDGFLALTGDDDELDSALLDIKDGLGRVALRENALVPVVFLNRFTRPQFCNEGYRVKQVLIDLVHGAPLRVDVEVRSGMAAESANLTLAQIDNVRYRTNSRKANHNQEMRRCGVPSTHEVKVFWCRTTPAVSDQHLKLSFQVRLLPPIKRDLSSLTNAFHV